MAGRGGDAAHAFPASRSRALARSGREAFFMGMPLMDQAQHSARSVIPAKGVQRRVTLKHDLAGWLVAGREGETPAFAGVTNVNYMKRRPAAAGARRKESLCAGLW